MECCRQMVDDFLSSSGETTIALKSGGRQQWHEGASHRLWVSGFSQYTCLPWRMAVTDT